ncbi:MAG TPA: thioester oxidase [Lentisphaeria bacterium]|nr:MAG: thioester oxidase [Lentisphaerae bacterium GWF2_38_69]HBM16738.1 thioester oxidase [Lentisphaeria bacterium]
MRDIITQNREFLKDTLRLKYDFSQTDQNRGIPAPPIQKPILENQTVISLPKEKIFDFGKDKNIVNAIRYRKSKRKFTLESLTLEELSFLLWATQGLRSSIHNGHAFRVVPSAGCRHSFETYIAAIEVSGLVQGIYRYLPIEHALVLEKEVEELPEKVIQATLGQSFTGEAGAVFIWSCIPYRMEWRYGPAAHRAIAFDAGHVCQNLYLAAQAISAGTCAIAAYNQSLMDELIGVDSSDEFVIYLAPTGKV